MDFYPKRIPYEKIVKDISNYLKSAYTDERLHLLLEMAENGELRYYSCDCLVGLATLNHDLPKYQSRIEGSIRGHYSLALDLPYAQEADEAYNYLGVNDKHRRELVIPIIKAEIDRRTREKMEVKDKENA